MGGEKNKGWRRGKRVTATRPVQMTHHLIVCEGKQTEPLYFEGMEKALGAANGCKLAVVVRGTGRHTLDLLDCALDCCRYASETYDHIWLVFDKDDFPAADFDAMECYRKNMGGLYEALASRRGMAARNAAKLAAHHKDLGESRPSDCNPCTRVGEIFEELDPYLADDSS